ncbi:hypothetical protein PMG11_08905 [Penicillium brasilianum]|uniref:Zn(2)-C6 fungal-type domain-containing protein n=1 Tax=Penicillium brasilianum TaxID=104259 RepID=A0A0F7TU91_PENBI|nr:hypothetical protein PMG11_08905 [Penicillium brasilianum]
MPPFKVVTSKSYSQGAARQHRKKSGHNATSCVPCRTAKLRCDRGKPCQECASKARELSCQYEDKSTSRLEQRPVPLAAAACSVTRDSVIVPRIGGEYDHHYSVPRWEPQDKGLSSDTRGFLVSDKSQTHTTSGRYFGSTHWAIFVAEFPEIRRFLEKDPIFEESWRLLAQIRQLYPGPGLPMDRWPHGSQQSMLRYLHEAQPSEAVSNILIHGYWSTVGQMMPVVPRAQWFEQYHQFHAEGRSSDLHWLLKTTAIHGLGFINDVSDDGLGLTLAARQQNGRCLAKIVERIVFTHPSLRKPSIDVLEIFLLLLMFKNSMSEVDGPDGICAILGMLQKLAFTLGLHRELGKTAGLSPGQVQRRREIWAMVRILDHEYSIHSGLPHTIRQDQCNSEPPSRDHHLDHTTTREEEFSLAWFSSYAKLTAQAAELEQRSYCLNLAISSTELQGYCVRLSGEMQGFKSLLDHEVSNLTNLWVSSGMSPMLAFYHLLLHVLRHRTTMLLYQPLLNDQPRIAWFYYVKAAYAMLILYQDFASSQTHASPSWWYFYHSFIKFDIYRAVIGLCYAVHCMARDELKCLQPHAAFSPAHPPQSPAPVHVHLPREISSRPSTALQRPSKLSSELAPDIEAMLCAVEDTRQLWAHNIHVGINHVKAFQLLSMIIACTKAELAGDDTFTVAQSEAQACLSLAKARVEENLHEQRTQTQRDCGPPETVGEDTLGGEGVLEISSTLGVSSHENSSLIFAEADADTGAMGGAEWFYAAAYEQPVDWDWFDQLVDVS